MTKTFKNTLLRSFDDAMIERLQLRVVKFKVQQQIEFPGESIDHLYFLEEGMASMTTTFKDGAQVEVGMFGYESVIGISALMGTKLSLNRVYTQIAGWGYKCRLDRAMTEFDHSGGFQRLALRYVQAQLVQAMQTAGCNTHHAIEQRLARWLLLCADRVDTLQFKLSQEFLSHMLGASRPAVTLAAGVLKREKLIEYTHGLINIVSRRDLEQRSCECYAVIKQHLDDYLSFDTHNMA